ncbi:hypothetical protein AB0G04_21720 [Actinoplanes sp. NPDC023801]|uniref:hypothetical protein n=1 Tax=Actinoplanes sp. NPDC023801 TaxID=3154595 RepID=UPI0033CE53EB
MPNLIRAGGEMFNFHDRPGVSSALLRHLTLPLAVPGRAVLIAGPHPDDLITALTDAGAEVTWVLRSLADAERATAAHPPATVVSGAFGKVDLSAGYDVVVAADGTHRLNSAEGEQLTAGELLDRLAAAVRPGGVLILMHDNQLGAHHTVRLEPGRRFRDDAAWYPADEPTRHAPASRAQLTGRITGSGLMVDAAWAAFPEPSEPRVLIGGELLGDVSSPLRPWLQTVLAQAYTTAFRGRQVISDPRGLVSRALRAGAEDTVAGGWLVVARVPGAGHPGREWPDLLVDDGHRVYTIGADGPRVLAAEAGPAGRSGSVEHSGLRRADLVRPATGQRLEDRLIEFCASAGLPGLRQEIGRYASWLDGQARDGVVDGPAALADLSDLAVTKAGPELLSARWEGAVPVQVALVRALWQFGVRLITWARPHPWPITASAADLAAILVGMAGRSLDQEDLRAAVDLQVTIDGAEFGLNTAEQRAHRLALLAVQPGTAPVDVAGYHELAEALWRQRYQASHLLAMMEWTENTIRLRDDQLSRMDWELRFHRSRLTGRALMAAKRAYRGLRK